MPLSVCIRPSKQYGLLILPVEFQERIQSRISIILVRVSEKFEIGALCGLLDLIDLEFKLSKRIFILNKKSAVATAISLSFDLTKWP